MNKQTFRPFRIDGLWYAEHWLIEPDERIHGRTRLTLAHPALVGWVVGLLSGGAAVKYFGFPF